MLPIIVAAVGVIAGMLVLAGYARREADQARQAQARWSARGRSAPASTRSRGAGWPPEAGDGRRRRGGPGPVQAVDGDLARPASARRAGQPHRGRRAAPRRGLWRRNAGAARLPGQPGAGRADGSRRPVSLLPFAASTPPSRASPRSRTASRGRRSSARGSDGSARWRSACCSSASWAGGCTGSSGGPRSPSRRVTPERRGEERLHALVRHSARGRLAASRPLHRAGRVQRGHRRDRPLGPRDRLSQLRRWHDEAGTADLQMSVNVSTRQLADPDLPRHVREAIDATGIDPTRLTLEITEHLLLDDGELMQRRLQRSRRSARISRSTISARATRRSATCRRSRSTC